MADDRIQIIVNEIKYWKEHKLLPESQCDFLLALYTQGEDESVTKKRKWKPIALYLQLFLIILLVPFSFLVVYFTQFNFILQLSILVLFAGYSFWVFNYLYNRKKNYAQIPVFVFLVIILILLGLLVNVLSINHYVTGLLFLLNFIGWYVISRRLQYKYLKISSFLAILILLFVNFSHLFSFNN